MHSILAPIHAGVIPAALQSYYSPQLQCICVFYPSSTDGIWVIPPPVYVCVIPEQLHVYVIPAPKHLGVIPVPLQACCSCQHHCMCFCNPSCATCVHHPIKCACVCHPSTTACVCHLRTNEYGCYPSFTTGMLFIPAPIYACESSQHH